ncbi:MAG: hypothetical protein AAF206_04240 [Bacteroidota bacterium]
MEIAFSDNIWMELAFLVVIPIPVLMIARLARKGASQWSDAAGAWIAMAIKGFYLIYFGYVLYMAQQGYFTENSLPPRILLYSMFPLLGFLLLVVFQLPITKRIIASLDLPDLVQLHVFRLIGSFFLMLWAVGKLPALIAWIAGPGDIITAISAIFVARTLRKNTSHAVKLTWIWNSFGLLDILLTSATALYLTKQAIDTGSQGVEALAAIPFCLIPAFAPATIIFLHLNVYRKLRAQS